MAPTTSPANSVLGVMPPGCRGTASSMVCVRALTRLADAGCTAHEIAAMSGHKTLSEVQRYTSAANQAKLAKAAMERIGNESVKPEPGKVSKPLSGLEKKLG